MSVYSTAPLFEDESSNMRYSFSKYDNVKELIRNYLFDFPRNKISSKFFKSIVDGSDIAGIFCKAQTDDDVEILDGLFGYIDIPAGTDGLICDLAKVGNSTYFFVYDNSQINQCNVRSLNFKPCGQI